MKRTIVALLGLFCISGLFGGGQQESQSTQNGLERFLIQRNVHKALAVQHFTLISDSRSLNLTPVVTSIDVVGVKIPKSIFETSMEPGKIILGSMPQEPEMEVTYIEVSYIFKSQNNELRRVTLQPGAREFSMNSMPGDSGIEIGVVGLPATTQDFRIILWRSGVEPKAINEKISNILTPYVETSTVENTQDVNNQEVQVNENNNQEEPGEIVSDESQEKLPKYYLFGMPVY